MSISIEKAKSIYGGETEEETLKKMAKVGGYRRIYKYANDFGDKITHTDYKRITRPDDPQEKALFSSPLVHNIVLVYDDGKILTSLNDSHNNSSSKLTVRKPIIQKLVGWTINMLKRIKLCAEVTLNALGKMKKIETESSPRYPAQTQQINSSSIFGRTERKKSYAASASSQDEDIKSSILMLGRNDLVGPPTHLLRLLELGDRAIPHLLPLLNLPLRNDRNDLAENSPEFQNNVTIVAEAAELLGKLGARQAIPQLRVLANAQWFEVQRNARTALIALERKTGSVLHLDRHNPYQQIADLWTAIFQGKEMPYPASSLNIWATNAIAAMSDLVIPEGKRDRAWAMLGRLYYKSVHSEWDGEPYNVERCPEAKRCFQEALRIDPNVSHWKTFENNL